MVQKDREKWRRLDLRHTSHELSPEFTCSCSDVFLAVMFIPLNYYEFTTYERERERVLPSLRSLNIIFYVFFFSSSGSLCVIAGVFANLFLPLAFFHIYFVTQSKSCLALNYGKPTLRKTLSTQPAIFPPIFVFFSYPFLLNFIPFLSFLSFVS